MEEALNSLGLWERRDHKPTGNLDQKTGGMLLDLFHKLNEEGNTILLITHDAKVAKEASRSVKILDGHVSETRDLSAESAS